VAAAAARARGGAAGGGAVRRGAGRAARRSSGCWPAASVPAAIEYLDEGTLRAAGATFPSGALPEGFLLLLEADGTAEEAARGRDALLERWGRRRCGARAGVGGRGPRAVVLACGVSHAVTARRGGKLSEDVAVPLDRLAEAITETVAIGERHGLEACSWGHAGDGNLHSTFLLEPGDAAQAARAEAAARDLVAMAIGLGGTISGEHGLGLLKNGFLSAQWSPAAVGLHRAVKAALDPKGLFNPGKKLP
jgi:FAD/FMN-containing dehydrogenase